MSNADKQPRRAPDQGLKDALGYSTSPLNQTLLKLVAEVHENRELINDLLQLGMLLNNRLEELEK